MDSTEVKNGKCALKFKTLTKQLFRQIGIEVDRFKPEYSNENRLKKIIEEKKIDLVIDVGANDGGYARSLISSGWDGPILSFEPVAVAYASLLKNAAGSKNWHIGPRIAIGETNGMTEINVSGNLVSSSIFSVKKNHIDAAPDSAVVKKEKISIQRLGEINHELIINSERIFLKIDTQGYEIPVLNGCANLMPKIYGIQVEMSLVELYEGQALYNEVWELITNNGFSLWNIIPGFTDKKSGRLLQFDGVFIKNPE